MSEDMKTNVIDMFHRHSKDKPKKDDAKIKFFAGFNYIKLKKDSDGKKFIESHLESYAEKCRYIVSIMRNINGEVCLYNYNIKGSDMPAFMKALDNNTLSGKLIEIEKYIPEDLA